MATGSRRLVVLALLANLAIAVTKFIAAAISRSSGMLAEAFHSVADTGNQLFLLRGHAASRYAPDAQHPFGRGKEAYFWSFMVAAFLFVGGGVLSIVTGVEKLRAPEIHGEGGLVLNFAVLGVAAFFEAFVAFRPALTEFNRRRSGRKVVTSIREAKDPALLAVLFEDTAALTGLAVAAVGLVLTRLTGDAHWDGVASVTIGLLLMAVAWVMAVEMKALLIGESASRQDRSAIRAATYSVDEVDHIEELLTMQLAPDEILVNMDVVFDEGLDEDAVADAIERIERAIRHAVPAATRIFVEPVR